MQTYNPFGKDIHALEPADLFILRNVQEGWYIEYKREIPNAKAIAKSISAFANTYGGWLFYGIDELSKADPVAGAFCGVDASTLASASETIRNAVANCLSTTPRYELKALKGPHDALGLAEDRVIICLHVPRSIKAPFVHSSGQIFRRVADSSDPRPETDRHILNDLWNRSSALEQSCREWVERDPELSKGESNVPYVRLMLAPDLWREFDAESNITLEQARSIFGGTDGTTVLGHIPFDAVHEHEFRFCARQTKGTDPSRCGLTWDYSHGLISDVLIPMNLTNASVDVAEMYLEGYLYGERFCDMLRKRGFSEIDLVDLNMLFLVIGAVVEQHDKLLQAAGWARGYDAKIRLLNVWRKVPFLDLGDYVADCESFGPPIVPREVITVPRGHDLESFHWIPQAIDDVHQDLISQALSIFLLCLRAFGVPIQFSKDRMLNVSEAWAASQRARQNQEFRSELEARQQR